MPPADPSAPGRLSSDCYVLSIRQTPERAKVVGSKEKASDRKPVDPPPIIQLRIRDANDPAQNYLQSPYYFMCCNLWDATEDRPALPASPTDTSSVLAGTVVSSLHRLKDSDNSDGGFFVFGDLSVKMEGEFRLRFNLFEMMQGQVVSLQSIVTGKFTVFSAKQFPGMSESTFLSRSFGDQGVRLRIRKETRAQKRPSSRGQTSGDVQYQAPRSSTINAPTPMAFAQNQSFGHASSRDYQQEYTEPPVKRQRSAGPGSRGAYDRPPAQEPWGYSQGPQAVGMYTNQAGSSYHGDNPAASHQVGLAYRNPADNTLVQSPYMARQQMGTEFASPSNSVGYDQQRGYSQQDTSSGQFGDAQGRLSQPLPLNRHGHPEQLPYQDMSTFGQMSAADQQSLVTPAQNRTASVRDQYYQQSPEQTMRSSRYSMPGNNMLPPISSSSLSGASLLTSSAPYTLPTYATQPQSQGSMRDYSGYSTSGTGVP